MTTPRYQWYGKAPRTALEWALAVMLPVLVMLAVFALPQLFPQATWLKTALKYALFAGMTGATLIFLSFAFGRHAELLLDRQQLEFKAGGKLRQFYLAGATFGMGEWWYPKVGTVGLIAYLRVGSEQLTIAARVANIDPFRPWLNVERAERPQPDFRLVNEAEFGELWQALLLAAGQSASAPAARPSSGAPVHGGDPRTIELVESHGGNRHIWLIPFLFVVGPSLLALTVLPHLPQNVGSGLLTGYIVAFIVGVSVWSYRRGKQIRGYLVRISPKGLMLSDLRSGKDLGPVNPAGVRFKPLSWEMRKYVHHYSGPALSVSGLLRRKSTIGLLDETVRWQVDCPSTVKIHYVCSKTDWPKLLTALAVNVPLGACEPSQGTW